MNYYTTLNKNKETYSINKNLVLSQKANFVMEVADTVFSNEIGYLSILKETMFDYCLINYYTDIVLFKNNDDFSLDLLEMFIEENGKAIIKNIKRKVGRREIHKLKMACDEAIDFKKYQIKGNENMINNLLYTISNEIKSITNNKDLDMSLINKLIDIIPIMKDMGSKEVAKAIVEEFH